MITAIRKLLEDNFRIFRLGLISLALGLVILGVVWVLMLAGLGFIIWAFYLYLITFLSLPIAALLSGLMVLLVAGGLILSARQLITCLMSQKKPVAPFVSWLRHYPREAALAAVAAGFLVGVSSELRKELAECVIWLLKQNTPEKHSTDQS